MLKADNFFRMNFILQDNAASTTRNYLSKIIEFVLFETKHSMKIEEIQQSIIDEFSLEFTINELLSSINKSNHIIKTTENSYLVSAEYANRLAKDKSIEEEIKSSINKAILEINLDISPEDLYDLITRYLYYCFNTNKEALLCLIDGNHTPNAESAFKANNEEISTINKYLLWDNEEKNALIYKLVSYCYVYCSLNTKKDVLLSKDVFRSKRFYLDANIIFRLAGINNDDRKRTINSFVAKCKELGIQLCYTDITFDEICRVIDSKVIWLKSITRGSEPIDLSKYDINQNDFYNMYVQWCKNPNNSSYELLDFKSYLSRIITSTLDSIEYVITTQITSRISKDELETKCLSLKEVKESDDLNRPHSHISLITDVKNVYFVDCVRTANSDKGNVFSTNDFFISADQNLISWTQLYYAGVPITVLPSLWLTIMLRFTGRTSDDYRAFCLFMNLRMHKENDTIDIYNIIRELNLHTSDKVLKEKIVSEIVDNKAEYMMDSSSEENCEKIVNKAFDEVLQETNEVRAQEYRKEIEDRERISKQEQDEKIEFELNTQIIKNARAAAEAEVEKRFLKYKIIKIIFKVIGIIVPALAALILLLYFLGFEPITVWLKSFIPDHFIDRDIEYLLALGGAISLIANVPKAIVNNLSSESRRTKMLSKFENKYKQMFSKK